MIAVKTKEARKKMSFFSLKIKLQQGTPRTASLKAAEEGPRFGANSSRHFVDEGECAHLFIEPDDLVHFVVVL